MGWKSRKLWITVLTMALLCLFFERIGHPPDQFNNFAMWLCVAAGAHAAGSVGEAAVSKRRKVDVPDDA